MKFVLVLFYFLLCSLSSAKAQSHQCPGIRSAVSSALARSGINIIQKWNYHVDLNFEGISQGDLYGRYRLVVQMKLARPAVLKIRDDEADYTPEDAFRLEGCPLVSYEAKLYKTNGASYEEIVFQLAQINTVNLPSPDNFPANFHFRSSAHLLRSVTLKSAQGQPVSVSLSVASEHFLQVAGLGSYPETLLLNNKPALKVLFEIKTKNNQSAPKVYRHSGRYLPI